MGGCCWGCELYVTEVDRCCVCGLYVTEVGCCCCGLYDMVIGSFVSRTDIGSGCFTSGGGDIGPDIEPEVCCCERYGAANARSQL